MQTLRLIVGLVVTAVALKHEDITYEEWMQEAPGKLVMLDMYAEW